MNNLIKKTISCFLAFCLLISLATLFASAKATVMDIDGIRTVFVGEMGKVIYNGKTYESFKTFSRALEELGTEGGRILFQGPITLGANDDYNYWNDIEGRKHVLVSGIETDNVIDFNGGAWIVLKLLGDTTFENVKFIVHKSNEYPFLNYGHKLVIGKEGSVDIDVGRLGTGTMALCSYNADSKDGVPAGETIYNSGNYDRIGGGSYYDIVGGNKIVGDVNVTLNGGRFKNVYAAHANTSDHGNIIDGDVYFTVNGGTVAGEFFAGSMNSGEVTGNVYMTINGGEIATVLKTGMHKYPTSRVENPYTANTVVTINGGIFAGNQLGCDKRGYGGGLEIFIINTTDYDFVVSEENAADYFLYMLNAKAEAKFDGRTFLGFDITSDEMANGQKLNVFANGEPVSKNAYGYFDIPKGMSEVTAIPVDMTEEEIAGQNTPQVSEKPWSNASDWALAELEKANEMKLFPTSLFGSDLTQPITRAEFAAVSVKVYEALSGNTATAAQVNPFIDCSDVEVLKALNVGITAGTSENTFSPDANLNREQAATMLTRAYKKVFIDGWTYATDSQFALEYEKPAPFNDDAEISAWAKDSVYFMNSNGLIKGTGEGVFSPLGTTTREQAMLIAVRMAVNLK